jgi:outer membrane protein assembly factor BamE (lipoprotein component of BamABCDE complex)
VRRLTVLAVLAVLVAGCGSKGFDTGKWEQGPDARPALVSDALKELDRGMTKAEVRDLLGQPEYTTVSTKYNASGFNGEQWTWLVGTDKTLRVVFNPQGQVKRIRPPAG